MDLNEWPAKPDKATEGRGPLVSLVSGGRIDVCCIIEYDDRLPT